MQDQFSIPRNKKCEAVGSTRFETRFSRDQDGQIEGWLNGEGIVHYKGPTVYQQQRGYPSHRYVYIKTGLYRDELQQPMTVYVDEYRKDELNR